MEIHEDKGLSIAILSGRREPRGYECRLQAAIAAFRIQNRDELILAAGYLMPGISPVRLPWSASERVVMDSAGQQTAAIQLTNGLRQHVGDALTAFRDDLLGRSNQDHDESYYSCIDRIEDNFGNTFTYAQEVDFSNVISVPTPTTLRVGETVTFRCQGTDPRGRELTWRLEHPPPGEPVESKGKHVDLMWTVQPTDTGNKSVTLHLRHEGDYHRHVGGDLFADATVVFYYRVLPPQHADFVAG